jgi:hypothetical protein
MTTENYILYLHGVSTRIEGVKPNYAHELKELINKNLGNKSVKQSNELYWGNVAEKAQQFLRRQIQEPIKSHDFWFQDFRLNQLLRFAGDIAIYISRAVGSEVVEELIKQIPEELKDLNNTQEKNLHFVTHSFGTIILFDILFAKRWDELEHLNNEEGQLTYKKVLEIRNIFFGMGSEPSRGIKLASIHTMGSPIAIFSLLLQKGSRTHDITDSFKQLLLNLQQNSPTKLPWRNYCHPGDPIAFPLDPLIYQMLDSNKQLIELQDIMLPNADFSDWMTTPFSQTPVALLHGGDAHGSYWCSETVAKEIIRVL